MPKKISIKSGDQVKKVGILIYVPFLLLSAGCTELVPLSHDYSQRSVVYSNLGAIRVNPFDHAKPEDEDNGSLKFTPSIDTFFHSTIETKIVQSHLFSISDAGDFELSVRITKFQSSHTLSMARMVIGCLGLAAYLGGSVVAIVKHNWTYFYVGTVATPLLIGVATLFDRYDEASVGFEYTIKRKGTEIFTDTVRADSTLKNADCSRTVLLDHLLDKCVDQMLSHINENVKEIEPVNENTDLRVK